MSTTRKRKCCEQGQGRNSTSAPTTSSTTGQETSETIGPVTGAAVQVSQLGPVVPSDTAKRNGLRNPLSTPALLCLKQAYPSFARLELTQQFRGHHSTFSTANAIFY